MNSHITMKLFLLLPILFPKIICSSGNAISSGYHSVMCNPELCTSIASKVESALCLGSICN